MDIDQNGQIDFNEFERAADVFMALAEKQVINVSIGWKANN